MNFYNSILFFIKNQQKKLPFTEAVLLFLVFFFPGYLYQNAEFSFQVMFTPGFHLTSLLFTLPQLLLLLYILHLRNGEILQVYGIASFRLSYLPPGLLLFAVLCAVTFTLGLLSHLLGSFTGIELVNPAVPTGAGGDVDYRVFTSYPLLPLYILGTSMLTGYFEELFFRVYLIAEFSSSPAGIPGIIGISSLLFAAGHLYQGLIGAMGTFLIGMILAFLYVRRRNWHEIAIAHGLYNFTMIMLMPLAA